MRRETGHDRDTEFTAFVEACGTRLFHTAELLTGDPHQAADLVQSSLERAYLRWAHITSDDPTAYVRRIMLNTQHNWWRRVRHREWPTADPPDTAAPYDPTTEITQRAYVLAALARLTPRERTVVVLRYYDDLSEATIADEVGIAVGTVKSTLARALGKLRALPEFLEADR